MRWQRLFDDLEGQAAASAAAERDAEVAERSRAELGRLTMTDRLAGAVGHPVRLHLRGPGATAGIVRRVGTDWLLLRDDQDRDVLVALQALTVAGGLGLGSAPPNLAPGSAAAARAEVHAAWDLRKLLRRLARDREQLCLSLVDGYVLHGTIDRVGADYLELAEHALGEIRRAGAVRSVATVVIAALASVRGS